MRERTPMDSPVRILAVTGDAVARFRLGDPEPQLLLKGSQPRCVAIDPRDPERVYVGTMDNGLWFSTDRGASWREAGPSIDEHRVLSVAVSRSAEPAGVSVVYAGTEPSNLYRSEDGGLSWQLLPALRELPSASRWSFPPRPWTHHVRTIALHPTDPESLRRTPGDALRPCHAARPTRSTARRASRRYAADHRGRGRDLVAVVRETAGRDRSSRNLRLICKRESPESGDDRSPDGG